MTDLTNFWGVVNSTFKDVVWRCCGMQYDAWLPEHGYGRSQCPLLYDVACGCGCGTGTAQCPFGYRQRGKR